MKPVERVIVYGLLSVLLALNLPTLSGAVSSAAHAAAELAMEALGPAESLTLTAADQKDVVLRNRKGRLAWSDDDYGKAYSSAFVHIGKALKKLMEGQALTEERRALGEELQKKDREYAAQLETIKQRGAGLERESPELRPIIEEYNKLRETYLHWGAEARARVEKLSADQLEKSYRELVNAVEIVGARRDIDMVYRFIPTAEDFDAVDEDQAMTAIRMRTMLRYPEGLDITPEVLEELSLSVD